jgi:hypothetical protein
MGSDLLVALVLNGHGALTFMDTYAFECLIQGHVGSVA